MSGTLTSTLQTTAPADPNFPIPPGYTVDGYRPSFDFGRNWFYESIFHSPNGGIAVTDLSTMQVIKTATLNQMYAGTPYGYPAGSPPSQSIYSLAAGHGTDLYILMDNGFGAGVAGEFCRFTRVDPVTMKVTGEFYSSAAFPPPIVCVMPGSYWSAVNTTTSHTIVAYKSNGGLNKGPQIMDGTGMAPIGLGPLPPHDGYQVVIIAGAKSGGTCDFLMICPDYNTTTGNIDIYRITVSDSLVITSTHTGTANVLGIMDVSAAHLYVAQADYDTTHDCMILQLTNSSVPTGPPMWVVSVNYNGTINWSQSFPSDISIPYSNGQSLLTGTTLMVGASTDLTMLDTATGDITFTGSIIVEGTGAGSFYRVYDASRMFYWTYALSRGFVCIDFIAPATLALDNVLAFAPVAEAAGQLVFLDWSDDRGHSWGNPVGQPIGPRGDYDTSPQWQRLGLARDRVFRLTWSVPVATALQGAYIEADTSAKS